MANGAPAQACRQPEPLPRPHRLIADKRAAMQGIPGAPSPLRLLRESDGKFVDRAAQSR